MIRIRNEVFNDYFIDPETAIITDKNGIVQETTIKDGRRYWKGAPVYKIQMHTHKGYVPKMAIHHLDKNKLNDALSNLMYVSNKEHADFHSEELSQGYERTDEIKQKISASVKKIMTPEYRKEISEKTKAAMTEEVREKLRKLRLGKSPWNKGKKHTEETREKIRKSCCGFFWWTNGETNVYSRECPDGFYRGRTIKKRPNK